MNLSNTATRSAEMQIQHVWLTGKGRLLMIKGAICSFEVVPQPFSLFKLKVHDSWKEAVEVDRFRDLLLIRWPSLTTRHLAHLTQASSLCRWNTWLVTGEPPPMLWDTRRYSSWTMRAARCGVNLQCRSLPVSRCRAACCCWVICRGGRSWLLSPRITEAVREEPRSRSSWWSCCWKPSGRTAPSPPSESWSLGRTCRLTWRGWAAATLSWALRNVPLWSSRRWRLLLKPMKLWGARREGPAHWGWRWSWSAPSRPRRRYPKSDRVRREGCARAARSTAEFASFSTTGTTRPAAPQTPKAPRHRLDWRESPSPAISSAPPLQASASRTITWVLVCPRGTVRGRAPVPAPVLNANLLTPTSLP